MNKATPYAVRHLDSVRHPKHSEGSPKTARYHNAGKRSLYSGRGGRGKLFGFTLFESLWVLLIITVLFCVGLSSIRSMTLMKKPVVLLNDLTRMLQFSRTQATLRGETLALRPLASNNNWAAGATLFVDNKTHSTTNTAKVLHVFHWKYWGESIAWHGFTSNEYLLIAPDLKQLAMNGYFELRIHQNKLKKICISRLGELNFDCV